MRDTIYQSKRDLWLMLLVGGSALVIASAAVAVLMQPGDWEMRLIFASLLTVQTMFILDMLLRTHYTLEDDSVCVRCGILRWRVPYTAIQRVRPSRTWLSGPALSLDRLIVTRTDSALPMIISPEDQQQFLEDLASRADDLAIVHGEVRRICEDDSGAADDYAEVANR